VTSTRSPALTRARRQDHTATASGSIRAGLVRDRVREGEDELGVDGDVAAQRAVERRCAEKVQVAAQVVVAV